ncbi:MAG: caspase family protein [Gammaproteobacteria bacterium]|jgi:hypothetical protein|nr:caspase family protein [Gammaproteobacteria bacterium]MBT3869889.1 caspase family protein [Gammaproteobacteria bacterium]MBT4378058.1 caspase family protein [Gammaproteobacteria bacterium]MBT4619345.1 caspase family protein [Gammaproteobacteria bacterium]MBT5198572.1 caspase family protein [Gammaproteobacteria bacterium]
MKKYGLLVVFFLTISTQLEAKDRYALIVGVSKYPFQSEGFNLVGPRNDALLIYDYLQTRDFQTNNIKLLTEDHQAAIEPTRGNILSSLELLVEETKAGDFLYLHFSGHGSQQPARHVGTEIDGLDEIFLPADTKQWNHDTQSVENVLTDDDVAYYVDAFRTKGVFVWIVFDSCHSGTMTRSQWQTRKIPADSLGVPIQTLLQTRGVNMEKSTSLQLADNNKPGGYVAFFAAQTTEETPEINLPKNSQQSKRYGLFTYNLMETLSKYPHASYQQVAEKILQNYSAQPWYGTTPMFIGSSLDDGVFGEPRSQNSDPQWKINRSTQGYEIPSGYLHGVTRGSILAVMAKPTDKLSLAHGFVHVVKSHSAFSMVEPIKYQLGDKKFAELTLLPDFSYARLVETQAIFELAIAEIPNKDITRRSKNKGKSLIKSLRKDGVEPIALRWVGSSDHADIRFFNTGDELVLLTDSEDLPCPFGACDEKAKRKTYMRIALDQSEPLLKEQLENNLRTIARALNLMRLGTVLEGEGLVSSLNVVRAGSGDLDKFDRTDIPTLFEGDSVSLYLANYLEEPLDITVLFIGADYRIDVVFPRGNQFNRFMEEEEITLEVGKINTFSTGMERLVVISSWAETGASAAKYNFLAQSGIQRTRGVARNPGLIQMLERAGFGQPDKSKKTRGVMPIEDSLRSQGSIHTIPWMTSNAN